MTAPAYWRAWRAAHPEYRERQNALRRARRARQGRGDRSAEYARRPSRALPALAPSGPPVARETLLAEDVAQARALAELEARRVGRKRAQARLDAYVDAERAWLRETLPLFGERP